jgi:hypothetical protein
MATPRRTVPRRLGETTRRKLEIASAMAWEALVETHVEQAGHFVANLEGRWGVEDALPRYLREMDLDETMATAIRTRVLARVEDSTDGAEATAGPGSDSGTGLGGRGTDRPGRPPRQPATGWKAAAGADDDADDADDGSWNLLRQPARVVRGVMAYQRRNDATDRIIQLSLARAEEHVIQTHVENAISVVALLEDQLPLDRCVQQYLGAVGLHGGRAQAVFQRTMARLADVHL